jgi:hypothetical protein
LEDGEEWVGGRGRGGLHFVVEEEEQVVRQHSDHLEGQGASQGGAVEAVWRDAWK